MLVAARDERVWHEAATRRTHVDCTPWNLSSGLSSSSVKVLGLRTPSSCDLGSISDADNAVHDDGAHPEGHRKLDV